MKHLRMDLKKEDQPEFLKPKITTLVDCNLIFQGPIFLKKIYFLKSWFFPFAAVFFLDFQDLSFLNIRFNLTLMPEVHFGEKEKKKTCKKFIFKKISIKILYFIPTSFDKFFETGQFEEKTNSVQCREDNHTSGWFLSFLTSAWQLL